jgi:hypothetical protein
MLYKKLECPLSAGQLYLSAAGGLKNPKKRTVKLILLNLKVYAPEF